MAVLPKRSIRPVTYGPRPMAVGRNEPCPCGSERKHKRCCLPLMEAARHELPALEREVTRMARDWRVREPARYADRLADFYAGGLAAFGWQGPDPEELLEADLWLLFAPDAEGGEAIVTQAAAQAADDRRLAALAASTLRAWWVEAAEPTGALVARCPFTEHPARLWPARGIHGAEARDGCYVVARTVALSTGQLGLLGRAPAVLPDVEAYFEALLDELAGSDGRWRDEGARLFRAAWSWPEEREHTREGTVVADAHVVYDLHDPERLAADLDRLPTLRRHHDPDPDEPWVLTWHRMAGDDREVPPPAEPGVTWTLCREDAERPARSADLQIDGDELWIFAPTLARLNAAERELCAQLGRAPGVEHDRHVEPAEIVPRWRRERWERSLLGFERRLGPALQAA